MVTTKQKPIIEKQKIIRKQYNHNTKESHQTTTEESKRRNREELQNSQKTVNKMSIAAYLSIITLSVNRLNSSIKRHCVMIFKKT